MNKPKFSPFFILLLILGCSKDPELRDVTVPQFSVDSIAVDKVRYDSVFDILGSNFPEVPVGVRITVSEVETNFTILDDSTISVSVSRLIPSGPSIVRVFRQNQEVFQSDLLVLRELVQDTIFDFAAIGSDQLPDEGPFSLFDFVEGKRTGDLTEWDIAIRGTTIAVNGGKDVGVPGEPERRSQAAGLLVEAPYSAVRNTENLEFLQDGPGLWAIPNDADQGWYQIDPSTQVLSPKAGQTLVFRTRDGRYAKMEIMSYYRGMPANPNPNTDEDRYYTFRYSFNPNFGENYLD